jgi:phenylpropionate dioxygenase-like ring-hydroxylating dioxygenase large terminal subunit
MTAAQQDSMALVRRALAHFRARTTDQAPAIMAMPVDAYLDADRYRREIDRVFREHPLALCLAIELPASGSYLAIEVMGVPVLLVRGTDGAVRGFLNVCRHRGARIAAPGTGAARVFACPYHAWTYDDRGALIGRYRGETFGEVDAASHGLTPLAVAERAGIVWGVLRPGIACDIDAWLGGMLHPLEELRFADWHVYARRDIPGPGWKVTLDGYLEVYHHDSVHGRTVGEHTVGNLLVWDVYGPHQRMVFGRRSLGELIDQPESAWEPERHIRRIHSVFPNLSISGILGDHCLVSQIWPGPTPATTITRQTVLCAKPPETAAEQAATEAFSTMTLAAVRDEDYTIGFGIQAALGSGANSEFLFGRNEPAVQHYHRWIAKLCGAPEPAPYV